MSTKIKKLYCKEEILLAQKELKNKQRYFYKKRPVRKTVQIRISKKWHEKIKQEVGPEKITMSSFMDQICKHFFTYYD